jgi:hypothetical protein
MKTCGRVEAQFHIFLSWHWMMENGQLYAPAVLFKKNKPTVSIRYKETRRSGKK